MGAWEAKVLGMTPMLKDQLEYPPTEEPNKGLNLTPSCEGTPPLDGPVSLPSSSAYSN
jgi:hypothetical protein